MYSVLVALSFVLDLASGGTSAGHAIRAFPSMRAGGLRKAVYISEPRRTLREMAGSAASEDSSRFTRHTLRDVRALRRAALAESSGSVRRWPRELVGPTSISDFVTRPRPIREDAPLCAQVRPGPDMHPSRVTVGRNWTFAELNRAYREHAPVRVVVFSARQGLGNTMRGLITTALFALLSGRQLAVTNGGVYGAAIDTMCGAFRCGFDRAETAVPRVPMFNFQAPVLMDALSVVQGNPSSLYEAWWYGHPQNHPCIMEALDCTDVWFDVAVHVRTMHKCVEGFGDMPMCHDQGVEHAIAVAGNSTWLRGSVLAHSWSCLSHLLSFLHTLKARQPQASRGILRTPEERTLLSQYFNQSAKLPGRRPQAGVNRMQGEDVWMVEDAQAVARDAMMVPIGPKGPLTILLATDSEALRPLFVEFLRPFGTVAYSRGNVMHLSHREGGSELRMGNMAEFYLMSRSSVVVSYTKRMSTYANMAAWYGNVSFIGGVDKLTCDFWVEHLAEARQDAGS